MREKPLEKLKRRQSELTSDLEIIKKAIEIIEGNPDWAILWEAMNH